jgi:putative lipase involved disintegration of autophagic bodies
VKKDQLNDNLLFSCCCARVGPTWSTVCGCYSGGYKCDQTCVEDSLVGDSLFYTIGIVSTSVLKCIAIISQTCLQNLYNNVTYMYPNANIWLIGSYILHTLSMIVLINIICGRAFSWRFPRLTPRCHLWRSCGGIRSPRRETCSITAPSPITRKYSQGHSI